MFPGYLNQSLSGKALKENIWCLKVHDIRDYVKETITAMKDIAVARYEAFGTAGNASKIKAVGLDAMTLRYDSGELDPKIN